MKNFIFFSFLFICLFLFSCEKDLQVDVAEDLCEMCDSHCCEQVGTEDCCCSGM